MKYDAIGRRLIIAPCHFLLFRSAAQAVNKLSKILLVTNDTIYISNKKEAAPPGQPRQIRHTFFEGIPILPKVVWELQGRRPFLEEELTGRAPLASNDSNNTSQRPLNNSHRVVDIPLSNG